MPGVPDTQWAPGGHLPDAVLGVLHGPGAQRLPAAPSGRRHARRHARRHRAPAWEPWPGYRFGVRPPEPGEVALSWEEVAFGFKERLLP